MNDDSGTSRFRVKHVVVFHVNQIDKLFLNTEINSENGKSITWNGLLDTCKILTEQKYLVHDHNKTLKYILDKRNLSIKNEDASLLSITPSTLAEQTHAKVVERKYSQLIIATITHDLKSPITAIQGNLTLLGQYIEECGLIYLKAAQASTMAFEFYIYDLIVHWHHK